MTTELARFVRLHREQLGKTQREVAEACGISQMAMALIEGGRRRLALERVPLLAHALLVDPKELGWVALRCRHPKFAAALAQSLREEVVIQ